MTLSGLAAGVLAVTGRELGQWLLDNWSEAFVCVAAPAYAADCPMEITRLEVREATYIPAGGIVARGLCVVFVADGTDHKTPDVQADQRVGAQSG